MTTQSAYLTAIKYCRESRSCHEFNVMLGNCMVVSSLVLVFSRLRAHVSSINFCSAELARYLKIFIQ
ncbi:hypothetical protein BDZ91DRAFT_730526 [Kalaharituber pfeilii]|nr:hypothetical protein BDZ91DRAFT_730526 [Kalaharituber pfeilii]